MDESVPRMQYKPIPAIPVLPAIYASTAPDFLEASRTGDRRPPPEMPWNSAGSGVDSACGPDDAWLRREIWGIAERYLGYGFRRIRIELCRRGFIVNGKRVRRIMREEGIWACHSLCESRAPRSGSSRPVPVYPNRLSGLEIVHPDQVWVVDVTRIMIEEDIVHLAVVLDVFTRRCLGWSLGCAFIDRLVLKAFRMALRARVGRNLAGLIHHSDQSLVGLSINYVRFLERNGILVSMSRRGYPYDNPVVESFFARFKCEEIYLHEYRTFNDAIENIGPFIQDVYNTKRIHSALGYRSPMEFEREIASSMES